MKKKITILIAFLVIILLFGFVGYFNHDQIEMYFNNKDWLSKEVFTSITTDDIVSLVANDFLVIANSDELNFYSSNGVLLSKDKGSYSKVKLYGKGAYTVVLTEDANKLYYYKEKTLLWEKQVPSDINNIIVCKNGYTIICYTPSGYKSGVSVYNTQGDILVTSYLASNYAVDATLSNDYKFLYIAEVNISGIEPQSYLRVIDFSDKESSKEIYNNKLINNEIITDIEYVSSEYLLALTDAGIYKISNDYNAKQLYKFEDNMTLFASITNCKCPFVVEQDMGHDIVIKRFGEETYSTQTSGTMQIYEVMDDKIAIVQNNEVVVYNEECKEIGRIGVNDNVISVKFVKNTNTLALIYKNKIEFVKV